MGKNNLAINGLVPVLLTVSVVLLKPFKRSVKTVRMSVIIWRRGEIHVRFLNVQKYNNIIVDALFW